MQPDNSDPEVCIPGSYANSKKIEAIILSSACSYGNSDSFSISIQPIDRLTTNQHFLKTQVCYTDKKAPPSGRANQSNNFEQVFDPGV